MELLDDLVDLQQIDGRASPFQVLHDLEEQGGAGHANEPNRVGLLRSRDVLQVSISCGSLGHSDKEDSMAMFHHQHPHHATHHHDHAYTSMPQTDDAHEGFVPPAAPERPRAMPYNLVQAAAPAQRTMAAATTSGPYPYPPEYLREARRSALTSRRMGRKRGPSTLGQASRAGWGSEHFELRTTRQAARKRQAEEVGTGTPATSDHEGHGGSHDSSGDSGEYCYICHGYYSEPIISEERPGGEMLLCDGCDKGWHQYCVNPPVLHIPPEDEPWFCPVCEASRHLPGVAACPPAQAAGTTRTGPPMPPPPPRAPVTAPEAAPAEAAGPSRKRTHSSSQGAVTGVQVEGGAVAAADGAETRPSAKKASGDTTSSNVSAAVKAEMPDEGGVDSGRRSMRVSARKSAAEVKAEPKAAPAAPAGRPPKSPARAAAAAATAAAAKAAQPRAPATPSRRPDPALMPRVCRPEKIRKYGATGKQALRITNFVGRTFFGMGSHCTAQELGPVKVELDGQMLPEVYTGSKIVLDHINSSPRLINFGGRHIVGIHYDCGVKREKDGTIVLMVTTREPNTSRWQSETKAAVEAAAAAAAAAAPKAGRAEKGGRRGSAAGRGRSRQSGAAAAAAAPVPPAPFSAPVRQPSQPLPSAPSRAPQPPPPARGGPPQPPPPAAPQPPLPAIIRPNKIRQLVTERGRKMCLSRMVFEALWPGITEGTPVDTQLDFIVDGKQLGPRRTSQIKMTEGGRVYASGVSWQEALHLWDCGMQRLSPKLVALYASTKAPQGIIPTSPAMPCAPSPSTKRDAPAADQRTPKRPRKEANPAPPAAPGLGRILAVGGQPASVAQGAGSSAASPPENRHSPALDAGASNEGGTAANNGAAAAANTAVSMAQLQQGGQALLELGQALGFSSAQRMAALKSVYALAREPGQLQLQLFLCMGLPHVKAEVDAGRHEEAWAALREVLPDL
eukprot:CAMPEP_0202886392 /NCGR_PEP_ID=MMETSP1391-20130828/42149_1 /ASSEMBLY_ACC=CAM_ASM_000867 /TAXON_ID=1034604 /ORGANISM="Chlamydomonas leiostraca, Strain SAG 11-49" /LENGTH=957 /DNA_ID=CAMNT_0049569663 /DNA_START=193 /DNA_END=3066 /DNA_ORIENTATION=-